MVKITRLPVSVVIHTKNAAKTLKNCLESVKWASDIVIVDMCSTDNTLKIAKEFTEHIVMVEDVGFADPMRNYGNRQARENWLLVLDADEEAPITYPNLLPQLMKQGKVAWYLPRKNLLFTKWLQHGNWWPDYQLRFFKKGEVIWSDKVHTLPTAKGDTKQAPTNETYAIIHHNYETISDFIDRMNRYTSLEVCRRLENNYERSLVNASDDFNRRYFAFEGYRDGTHGLYVEILQAIYEFIVNLKQWEKVGFPNLPQNDELQFALIKRTFTYWYADRKIKTTKSRLWKLYWRVWRKFRM